MINRNPEEGEGTESQESKWCFPGYAKSSVIDLISQICVLSVPKRLGDVRFAEDRQSTATASVRASQNARTGTAIGFRGRIQRFVETETEAFGTVLRRARSKPLSQPPRSYAGKRTAEIRSQLRASRFTKVKDNGTDGCGGAAEISREEADPSQCT